MAGISSTNVDNTILFARGRLSEARKWFAYRGWSVLPKTERGRRILKWGATHAWMAGPADPKDSVRRWCRSLVPWLTNAQLDKIVADTKKSNKRWSADQSATVLGITVRDRTDLGFRFLGASDDHDYKSRRATAKEKAAARARKSRAARSTGAKRGRPKSEGIPAWMAAGFSSRRSYYRHKARGTVAAESGTKNASRHISKNRKRDGISVPHVTGDNHSLVPSEIAATKPPAKAVGTPSKRFPDRVDAAGIVGNPSRHLKTRFKTSMRLSKELRQYALDAMFEPAKVDDMFESFGLWNRAKGSYSLDWDEVWCKWVDREVDIHNAADDRARARDYWMRQAA
jgi:hypothetical protein